MRGKRIVFASAGLLLALCLTQAAEKPPDSVFQQSPLEFSVTIPPRFKTTKNDTGYVPTPVGNVPYREQDWQGKKSGVAVKRIIMPEVWWSNLASSFFAFSKLNLPGAPNVKIFSDRDYFIGNYAAHSFVFSAPSLKPSFWRVDYFLIKPDLYQVMYTADSQPEVEGPDCKKLYESISVKPREQK